MKESVRDLKFLILLFVRNVSGDNTKGLYYRRFDTVLELSIKVITRVYS